MKPNQRKRKTNEEALNCSSKKGKVPGSADSDAESKYFKAGSSKKSPVELKRALNRKRKGVSTTSIPGSSGSEGNAAVLDGVDSVRVPEKGNGSKITDVSESVCHKKSDIKDKAKVADAKELVATCKLDFRFYDRSCEELAKALLGQVIVTRHEGKRLAGKIVETEAYLGPIDKAAHSYKGKTDRNTAMFMKPGTAYVYNIYGMYCCLNISAQGDGCAVLIRALQPVENLEVMDKLRSKGKEGKSLLKKDGKELCNGPSKLCQALAIKKDTVNKEDLCTSDEIWLEKGEIIDDSKIVKCKRININYAEEWIDKPLRFYILENLFSSVRDKNAEKDLCA